MTTDHGHIDPTEEPFDLPITDSLDLHAFHPKDVAEVTRVYLREARDAGFTVVRIIHGKGIGVQRDMVRKILSETAFVRKFKDAPEFSGSWGATIIHFDQ